jgi:uroporphyrinogen decarboxylase
MNSRQVVTAAIEFHTPARLPLIFPRFGVSDTHSVGWNQVGTGSRALKHTLDEWGCEWVRSEIDNMGQVKGHPLEAWDALAHYRWPDPDDPAFFEGMEARFAGSDGKYVMTGIFMLLFERMHALRGFQNVLEDLLLERERAEDLAERILEFDLRLIENIATRFPGQIHGFSYTDDWGTQQDTFISPKLWSEFFLPRYTRLAAACHAHGWHVWMHSCGRINRLIPGLLQAGIDVLNLEQPRALGIEEIGRQFAGKVCFSSGCDIQQTLPVKNETEIRAEARLLLDTWATPQGGFILADDENDSDLGTPPEKKQYALQAFLDFDPWKKKAALPGQARPVTRG